MHRALLEAKVPNSRLEHHVPCTSHVADENTLSPMLRTNLHSRRATVCSFA